MNFRQDFNSSVRNSLTRKERATIRSIISFVIFYSLLAAMCIGAVFAFSQIGG